jgi:hypothetical protein
MGDLVMAGRPRTPLAKARATGRTTINPARYAKRSDPKVQPLGDPPAYLSEGEKAFWDHCRTHMSWLAMSDRCLVEIAARARTVSIEKRDLKAMGVLIRCLASMGATPVDRSKVMVAPDYDPDDDPANEYLN